VEICICVSASRGKGRVGRVQGSTRVSLLRPWTRVGPSWVPVTMPVTTRKNAGHQYRERERGGSNFGGVVLEKCALTSHDAPAS